MQKKYLTKSNTHHDKTVRTLGIEGILPHRIKKYLQKIPTANIILNNEKLEVS